MRSKSAQALRGMLVGRREASGFEMKLNFAVVLGIVRTGTKDRLTELNTLRNKCSHNSKLCPEGAGAIMWKTTEAKVAAFTSV